MITEAFQVILKFVAPGQEDIVIQNVCKKLSFVSNDSEEKLDSMAEVLNEAYQHSQSIWVFWENTCTSIDGDDC
jgi:hypothetical protein